MAGLDRNFTDELRARLSLVDVIGRRIPLNKKGQNYWGCCPFHNEKTPSFCVNEEKGIFKCFGCGEGGDIVSFTMKRNNLDFRAAIQELADMAGIKMPVWIFLNLVVIWLLILAEVLLMLLFFLLVE